MDWNKAEEALSDLQNENPELEYLIQKARGGVSEFSTNWDKDYPKLLEEVRKLVRMRNVLRAIVVHAKETYPHWRILRTDLKEAEEALK